MNSHFDEGPILETLALKSLNAAANYIDKAKHSLPLPIDAAAQLLWKVTPISLKYGANSNKDANLILFVYCTSASGAFEV